MTTGINTGLPPLPEDHFWRVGTDSVEIRKTMADTDWIDELPGLDFGGWSRDTEQIIRYGAKKETRVDARTVTTELTVKRWFKTETVPTRVVQNVYQHRYVGRSIQVVFAQTEKNGDTTRVPGHYHSAEYQSNYGYNGYMGRSLVSPSYREPDKIIEHRHPVTRQNIQSLCEKALERFNALSLIGDYPPKKLEA